MTNKNGHSNIRSVHSNTHEYEEMMLCYVPLRKIQIAIQEDFLRLLCDYGIRYVIITYP
jgi:hypothetical protein